VLSVQLARLLPEAVLLIIRRSWVRAPPAPPSLTWRYSPITGCRDDTPDRLPAPDAECTHAVIVPSSRPREPAAPSVGGGQVRLDQHVGVPVVDVPAGVTDLAHADLLVHSGIAHQRVAGVPSALMQLDDGREPGIVPAGEVRVPLQVCGGCTGRLPNARVGSCWLKLRCRSTPSAEEAPRTLPAPAAGHAGPFSERTGQLSGRLGARYRSRLSGNRLLRLADPFDARRPAGALSALAIVGVGWQARDLGAEFPVLTLQAADLLRVLGFPCEVVKVCLNKRYVS
jgi:hypothetical protein